MTDSTAPGTTVRRADLSNDQDARAVVELVALYALTPHAGSVTLSNEARQRLPAALDQSPGAVVFLAFGDKEGVDEGVNEEVDEGVDEGVAIGVAVCFEGLSTFTAKPKLNLHDLMVVPEARGRGVGRALMDAVLDEARRRGCGAATLEVHPDNDVAKGLYRSRGFAPGYEFWTCAL